MADKAHTLFLPSWSQPDVPFEGFPLVPTDGHVYIQMDPKPEKRGSILLPQNSLDVSGRLRSDTATVLSSAVEGLEPGDWVLVVPYVGTFLKVDGWDYPSEVRLLGSVPNGYRRDRYEVWEDIVAIMDGETMKPFGKNVLLKRDPKKDTEGFLILADNAKVRPDTAVVQSIGKDVKSCKVGDRVVYSKRTMLDFDFGREGFDDDLAFVDESAILAILH